MEVSSLRIFKNAWFERFARKEKKSQPKRFGMLWNAPNKARLMPIWVVA